ncbi:MAG: signal peptidase II [Alphaproteobacteria bacterium]|jgi:signal peptidase II|nr:signal peptidase II [Alphaproteobacteria bacterium]MBP9868092.1 signal peptidase II [Alphaproteobacteria bacterium]
MTKKSFFYALIPILALLDQLSKWWVIERFFRTRTFEAHEQGKPFGEWLVSLAQTPFPPVKFEITPFFNLVMVWNKGVSFGMFASDDSLMPLFLGGTALLMCCVFLIWIWKTPHLMTVLPLVLICAGAISNVWDRARFGGVADFLDFYWGDIHYPAFNLADSFIVLGVAWLAFDGVILEPRRLKKISKPSVT